MHLVKEEQALFQYIVRMGNAVKRKTPFPRPPFETVQNPVRMMVLEHDSAGTVLHEMRRLSGEYQVPADGCGNYRALYDELKTFESDMHQRVHLENKILVPGAGAMEEAPVSGKKCASN